MFQIVKLPLIQIEICLIVELKGLACLLGISENLMLFFILKKKKNPKYNSQHPSTFKISNLVSQLYMNLLSSQNNWKSYYSEAYSSCTDTHQKKILHFSIQIDPKVGKVKELQVNFRYIATPSLTSLLLNTGLGGIVVCSSISSECLYIIYFWKGILQF